MGISVLGGAVALMGAAFFGAGIFGSGVAEAAFPGADGVGIVSQTCMPDGTTQATLGWTSYNQGTQWIDLSTSDPGFAPGTFVSSGAIASGQNSFTWTGLQPGVTYFARVDSQTGYGWVPSAPITFVSQACAATYTPGYVPGFYGYVTPPLFPPETIQPSPVQPYPYYAGNAPVIVPQTPIDPGSVSGTFYAPAAFHLHRFHHRH